MAKKCVCFLFVVAMLISAINVRAVSVKAESLDEADLCLQDSIQLMVDEEVESLGYTRRELYNRSLIQIGYAYEMYLNGEKGFALMINLTGYYEVTELYLRKESPFTDILGSPIYLTPLCYIEYVNEQYRDIESDIILSEEQLRLLEGKGFGYNDDSYSDTSYPGVKYTETFNYDYRVEEKVSIQNGLPAYFNTNTSLKNMCAVNAGAVVVGYYSRYYPVLTPGFVVGMEYGGGYLYWNDTTKAMQPIMEDLYDRMGTNQGGDGTTATGFRNGLQSYVNSKGLNISYTSISSNNTLNYDSYKSFISNKIPCVLFFNTYNVALLTVKYENAKTDLIDMNAYNGMHVMIGYGYEKYTYYKNNSVLRTDYYLRTYTGVADSELGCIKLYDRSVLVEGYAINIY